ncbi:uncharacterized protein ACA1_038120 [Acanthamoeba castellanii str. Neff]|uniref:Uncharacterized protein n=1 Tax=Acanthamoeba castellanii (strain ATCC 30010 / Neff) TaxID=1257118 RepID=L8GKV1_ACACF|nr:uncharacterized protein ACA1_038120 [Acanthamoeba castellanii str. Neff]ELR13627.1 hypothetical protein ACA1_038120 [Acanthamoeba castellanii str. Neff]
MESSGECRGCQRNIKFAVKQARLCRTCYNKTYLTSQKRREYYKNKKKRRETTSSVEPAIDVHQHRHGKSIKKEDFQENRSPPRTLPDNLGQDPVAAHLYLLSYQSRHTQSCSDCVPQAGLFASAVSSSASPAALSLAALAHASQHHASSSPASPQTAGSTNGSLPHHLSSATTSSSSPCSPASSPPLSMASYPQQLHVQYHVAAHHHPASPASASSSALVTPYGSPPTPGPVLFQDLLQQMSYYAAMVPMLGLAPVAMPTEMFATTSTTSSSSFSSSSSSSAAGGLPSLSTFFPTSSTNPLAIPTPRYPPSTPQPSCQQCHSSAASAQRFDTTTPEPTWLCDTCLANRRHGAQPATRSPAIKNLLN